MAKKFVRGVTDVKDIEKFDISLTNVNDIISDGQHTYIHTKKGETEGYYNLTNNINGISSSNTDLIDVTNSINTTTLNPKHDAQKEQVLESERNTVTINHGTNATSEKTKVDTNPAKVLEHDNIFTRHGISKTTTGNTTQLGLEYTLVEDGFDLNTLKNGNIRCSNFINSPKNNTFFFVSSYMAGNNVIQQATTLFTDNNVKYVRACINNNWSAWREQVGDKSVIDKSINANTEKINQLTARVTALEEKVAQLQGGS